MADPALPSSMIATDTDYGLEATDTAFIGRTIAMADRHAQVQSDSQAASAQGFVNASSLREQWLGEFTSSMAGIKAAAFSGISSSTADSILNNLILGGQVLGSPKSPLPAYMMGGGGGGGNGGGMDAVIGALQAIAVKLTAIAAKVGA